mgnify:CR=1 FL=1
MSMGDMSLNEMQKLRVKLSRKQPGAENLDQLTGVLKKDAAEAQIALRLREGRGGTIFICDVDHLKKINEKYGHGLSTVYDSVFYGTRRGYFGQMGR